MTFRELRRSFAQACVNHFRDALAIVGMILIPIGIAMCCKPLAVVVLGIELIGFAVLTGKR